MRDERTPATAQGLAYSDRDEACTLRSQQWRHGAIKSHLQGCAGIMGAVANRVTHNVKQQIARHLRKLCGVGVYERKRAVAYHPLAQTLCVAGVAHIQGRDPQIPPLRLIEQAVY